MNLINCALISLLALSLSACQTVDQGRFSVMSLSPIDKDKTYKKVEENATGVDTGIYWAFYAGTPKLDAALADALSKSNGDYMTNVRVKWSFWVIPIIYGEKKYEVTGEVWRADKTSISSASAKPIPVRANP